jgi:hypothetical protein
MPPPAHLARVAVATAAVALVALALSGCTTPDSPRDAAVEAWNRHLRLATEDLVTDRGLVDEDGSPVASNGCREGERIAADALTLYDCTLVFEDGTRWGGVVRVNDDGTAFIREPLHPLAGRQGAATGR